MIKITAVSAPDGPIVRLRVDGRIVSRTAPEIAQACAAARTATKPVLLDLSGVGYVDGEGACMLAALIDEGITPIGCSAFVRTTLRDGGSAAVAPADPEDPDPAGRLGRRAAAAPAALARRHGPAMLALTRRLLRREADARDAVRDAFQVALAHEEVPEAAELRRLVAEAAMRRLPLPHGADEALAAWLPRFDDTGHWADEARPLRVPDDPHERPTLARRALDRLPEPYRAIVVLCDREGLTTEAVAGLLATTAATVAQRLHRARQALRTLLAEAAERAPSSRAGS